MKRDWVTFIQYHWNWRTLQCYYKVLKESCNVLSYGNVSLSIKLHPSPTIQVFHTSNSYHTYFSQGCSSSVSIRSRIYISIRSRIYISIVSINKLSQSENLLQKYGFKARFEQVVQIAQKCYDWRGQMSVWGMSWKTDSYLTGLIGTF